MAKDPEGQRTEERGQRTASPTGGAGAGNYTVTFVGCPPRTVKAGSPEEAIEVAKKEMGVVSFEKPPDVVPVST